MSDSSSSQQMQCELTNIKVAIQTATEAIYAQGEAQQGGAADQGQPSSDAGADDVQDVDYEEVK